MSRRVPDIEVHIETLVLHGVGNVEPEDVRAGLEQELARRLERGGLDPRLASGGRMERLHVPDLRLPHGAERIGADLGRALSEGLAPPCPPSTRAPGAE
jgi:hypothetical protein